MEKRIEKEGLGMRLGKRPVIPLDSECFTWKAFYEQGTHISWVPLRHLTEKSSLLLCKLHHADGEST